MNYEILGLDPPSEIDYDDYCRDCWGTKGDRPRASGESLATPTGPGTPSRVWPKAPRARRYGAPHCLLLPCRYGRGRSKVKGGLFPL